MICFCKPIPHFSWLFLVAIILSSFALPVEVSRARELEGAQPIAALQFRSFDSGWLRYYNLDMDGDRKLVNDSGEMLSFRRVLSTIPLGITELEDANTIKRLIYQHALLFDMERIDGHCDTEKLIHKNEDILCVPGSSALPIGYIFLVLYHPQTQQIDALTTTIDNSTGRANPAAMRDSAQAEEFAAESQPAMAASVGACGSYVPGQWITAADYAASGLNLPTNTEDVGNPKTDYRCILPEDGATPYLQAYSLIEAVADDDIDDDDEDDDDDDDDEEDDEDDDDEVVDC